MQSTTRVLGRDPICGMYLSEEQAVATYQYIGRTYVFCSTECRELFAVAPERTIVILAHGTDAQCVHRCPQQRAGAEKSEKHRSFLL